jgi:hypothetical protein
MSNVLSHQASILSTHHSLTTHNSTIQAENFNQLTTVSVTIPFIHNAL